MPCSGFSSTRNPGTAGSPSSPSAAMLELRLRRLLAPRSSNIYMKSDSAGLAARLPASVTKYAKCETAKRKKYEMPSNLAINLHPGSVALIHQGAIAVY